MYGFICRAKECKKWMQEYHTALNHLKEEEVRVSFIVVHVHVHSLSGGSCAPEPVYEALSYNLITYMYM